MKPQKVKRHAPTALPWETAPVPIAQENESGPRFGLDGYGKRDNHLTLPGFELRTFLSADSRFTDYPSPTPQNIYL
jgi:hypothetical protein